MSQASVVVPQASQPDLILVQPVLESLDRCSCWPLLYLDMLCLACVYVSRTYAESDEHLEASMFTAVSCATASDALQEPGAAPAPVKPPPTDDDALDDSKFDEFMGSDAGAFASFGEYDQVTNCCFTALLASPAIIPTMMPGIKWRSLHLQCVTSSTSKACATPVMH